MISPLGGNEAGTSTGQGTGKPGEKALEGPQQPTLVLQKFAPPEIQVGKPAKFVLQIRNAGAQTADGVVIRDEVPQGTKLVSTSPNATTEGSHITWQVGKLSPGEDRSVEMQLMPVAEGEIGSVATVSYSAQVSVKSKCTMPQRAIRMTAANEVMSGNQEHVKIEIRNPGSGDATGVMLFENVPPNVTPGIFVCTSPVMLRISDGAVIFGSKNSMCDGPPLRNTRMQCFARRAASISAEASMRSRSARLRLPSVTIPACSNSRRVRPSGLRFG